MTAFAAADDLRLFLRLPEGGLDTAAADALLAHTSDVIRGDVDQQIDRTAADTPTVETLSGRGMREIVLSQLPVLSIVTVTEDGDEMVAADYAWDSSGVLERLGSRWSATRRGIVVTYHHGHDPVPDVVRRVCVQAAARAWVNPAQLRSETIGDWARSWSTGTDAPTGRVELTDYEKRLLDPLRP